MDESSNKRSGEERGISANGVPAKKKKMERKMVKLYITALMFWVLAWTVCTVLKIKGEKRKTAENLKSIAYVRKRDKKLCKKNQPLLQAEREKLRILQDYFPVHRVNLNT